MFKKKYKRILAANKKYKEAVRTLNKIAKYNGTHLINKITVEELLIALNSKESKVKLSEEHEVMLDRNASQTSLDSSINNHSAWYFLTHPFLNLFRFIIVSYVWIAITMVYFGVSLGKFKI